MSALEELLAIMARLRGPEGCPWDRQQTFASIAPYTLEETYEVLDAIERADAEQLREELGDLLFQVVFHAQMAHEAGEFDFEDVARGIGTKLIRRHPHVFGAGGPMSATEQSLAWESAKAEERAARAARAARAPGGATKATGRAEPSALEGVPATLPALMRAHKLSKRAAHVGFDWDDPAQTAEKVAEELREVCAAAGTGGARGAAGTGASAAREPGEAERERRAAATEPVPEPAVALDRAAIFEEVGDLLFAAANLARKLDVDAEAALRAANAKFERRFRAMEALARARELDFARLPLEAQEQLWQEVKRRE